MTNQSEHINKGLQSIILLSLSQKERLPFISGANFGFDLWRLMLILYRHITSIFSARLPIGATAVLHSVSDTPIFKFASAATPGHTPPSTGARHD